MYYRIKLQNKDNIKIFIKKIIRTVIKTEPVLLEGIIEFNKNKITYELIYNDASPKLNETISGWMEFYNFDMYNNIKEVIDECPDEKIELNEEQYTKLNNIFKTHNEYYRQSLDIIENEYKQRKQKLFENYNDTVKNNYEYFINEK